MSVSTTATSQSFTSTGGTTYPITAFSFFDSTELLVVKKSGGVSTTLVLGTDYSVTGGAGSTGNVITTTAIPSGVTLIVSRVTSKTQLTSYTTGDRFPASAQEKALDRLTMIAQENGQNSIPNTTTTSGSAPFVLGISDAGGTPYWVSQTASSIADGAITTAKIANAAITPAKLSSNGNITWDATGNITAPSFIGSTTATAVASGSVTPAGLAGSVGANAWVSKTANYTAVIGDRIEADTSSSAFTITLPASPTLGSMITFADAARTWATNNLTVARNGNTIEALSEDLVCNVSGKRIAAVYNGSTWRIY